jgi:hypothetical protein
MFIELVLSLTMLLTTCDSKDETTVVKPAVELLTQDDWKMYNCGYDNNRNGRIDPSEESVEDCQRDDTYVFRPDGTATLFDNDIPCAGVPEQTVRWRLIDRNKKLDLQFHVAGVLKLSENELIIYEDVEDRDEQPVRFITTLIH